jgi:hypothetical protein
VKLAHVRQPLLAGSSGPGSISAGTRAASTVSACGPTCASSTCFELAERIEDLPDQDRRGAVIIGSIRRHDARALPFYEPLNHAHVQHVASEPIATADAEHVARPQFVDRADQSRTFFNRQRAGESWVIVDGNYLQLQPFCGCADDGKLALETELRIDLFGRAHTRITDDTAARSQAGAVSFQSD